ncbi:hypothetical protein B0H14DRAFT_2708971 [Mycena olivaceomarginata]|nr:hypothetical protein B0H14DRAFT_2708971 [Mycena olivaceomarginata]
MALNGWHRGETAIQRKLGTFGDYAVSMLYMHISGDLPGEHAYFHSTRLPFVPVTTLDSGGRPWGSILAGKDGKPGFISAPKYSTLRIDAKLWDGEPLLQNSKLFGQKDPTMLVAGIAISQLKLTDNRLQLDLQVNEAIGNCPKYINVRNLTEKHTSFSDDRLPDEAIAFITAADTVFLGTTYKAFTQDALKFPSHLGMNQRGGRPGFILVIPDFSGNRFMTSLGNIEATPMASLTFVDFESGDILYLTGGAENLVDAEASQLMPFQKTLTTVYVTGYTLVRDALPVRQRKGTSPERSRSIATFTWDSSVDLDIKPGQAIIMDPLTARRRAGLSAHGAQEAHIHQRRQRPHMDRLVLQALGQHPLVFADDAREARRGGDRSAICDRAQARGAEARGAGGFASTRAARRHHRRIAGSGISDAALGLTVPLAAAPAARKMLWVAGGIGVTPFLSMLKALGHPANATQAQWDVRFLLATREPEVLIPLIADALVAGASASCVHLTLEVFSTQDTPEVDPSSGVVLRRHVGRLPTDFFDDAKEEVQGRQVFLCGSPEFEKAALAALGNGGVPEAAVKREGFAY